MRLASLTHRGEFRIGDVSPDATEVTLLSRDIPNVRDIIVGAPSKLHEEARQETVPLQLGALLPPLTCPDRDILCTGWNYLDHFEESKGRREGQDPDDMPDHPTFFGKAPGVVTGPYGPIQFDAALSSKWDYEAEVVIVIGRAGRSIAQERALDHVFGYCLANDISQRDLQRVHGGQWLKGKSIDGTMPIGPWITTADEIEDPTTIDVACDVNGRTLQSATVGQMAFSLPRLISELSNGMTLNAGDILLTGTPSGIGNARDPQVFLTEGDVVVTRSSVLGTLSNHLVSAPLTVPQ